MSNVFFRKPTRRGRPFRAPVLRVGCLMLLAFASDQAAGLRAGDQRPVRHWAILIGVEKYTKARPLAFIDNDVRQLSNTLQTRCGFQRTRILEITDLRSDRELQPWKETLLNRLSEWLAKPAEGDSIIVYFSGHGFRDSTGRLYLAPRDCDPANPTATGIPVTWFRDQLARCKARFKLLLLDACHAGSDKGEDSRDVSPNEIGSKFEDLERVITIASSQAAQPSQVWTEKQQSLFSYWLVQALRGHADRDGNGRVDIHELYEYLSRNVKQTAKARLGSEQTPVRIVGVGVDGVPDVAQLRPQHLKVVLADIAEQLAYALEERGLSKVGVLEFINETPGGEEALGARFGLLGKYCAEELERQIRDQGQGRIRLVEQRVLKEALKESRFRLASLGSVQSVKALSQSAGGMPVMVVGTLANKRGGLVQLQCKLQQTQSDEDLGVSAAGLADLSESEWAMQGRSVVIRPEERRPQMQEEGDSEVPHGNGFNERQDEKAAQPHSHPLQDPAFPFNVSLKINNEIRKGVFRGNDYFVPVRKGEKYKIIVENKSGQTALMRLLLDGLNTLPEKERQIDVSPNSPGSHQPPPGIVVQKGLVVESWGRHVDLEDARAWVLDPNDRSLHGGPAIFSVAGFATTTGTNGTLREFEIVDANDSLAARQNFSDEIGLITAAFYSAKAGPRGGGLGTAAGSEVGADLTERAGITTGNLIGVVHIHYVDADTLRPAPR